MADPNERKKKRRITDDLLGVSRLAIDATKQVTGVVEDMHQAIGGGPAILGRPLAPLVTLFSAPVYASIRGVTELVGAGLEVVLKELAPLLGEHAPSQEVETVCAALNGVVGDHLFASGNPLAVKMELKSGGHVLDLRRDALATALPKAGNKVVVLVHGTAMNDSHWLRRGHHHGDALANDLGLEPVTVRYNSGLHISTNGRELAGLLEQLVDAWPQPLEALVLLGFSMGGLVTRAALHVAEEDKLRWLGRLSAVVFLGTPHHGSPLERIGNVFGVFLDATRYSAPIGRLAKIRSAGITDLRHGNVLDAHWQGRDRFAHAGDPRVECRLPPEVPCFAVAATATKELPAASADQPLDLASLASDGLVPVASALGRHREAAKDLQIPIEHQRVIPGSKHLDLLSSRETYAQVRAWLSALPRK